MSSCVIIIIIINFITDIERYKVSWKLEQVLEWLNFILRGYLDDHILRWVKMITLFSSDGQ